MTNFNGKQRNQDRANFCTHDCEFVLHEMTLGDFESAKCNKVSGEKTLSPESAPAQDYLSQNGQIEADLLL